MKAFAICASILWLSTVVLSTSLWRELRAARQELAVARASQTVVASIETMPAANDPRSLPEPLGALSEPSRGSPPTVAGADRQLTMLDDPEYRESRRREIRLSMPERYPGLAAELGLSAAEANQLFDLLASQAFDQMLTGLDSRNSQGAVDSRLVQQRQRADVAALLGSTYPQYEDYLQTRPTRVQVAQVQRSLQASGQGLSEDQLRAFTKTAVAERKRLDEELLVRRDVSLSAVQIEEQRLRLMSESSERLIQAIGNNLSAAQLEAVRTVMDGRVSASRSAFRTQGVPGADASPRSP